MSDNLKNFIQQNRNGFDTLEPSADLWNKINSGMGQTASTHFLKASKSWWKFAFSASVVAVGAFVYVNSQSDNKKEIANTMQTVNTINTVKPNVIPENEVKNYSVIPVNDSLTVSTNNPIIENHSCSGVPSGDNAKEDYTLPAFGAPYIQNNIPEPNFSASIPSPYFPQINYQAPNYHGIPSGNYTVVSTMKKSDHNFLTSIDTTFAGIKRLEVEGRFCNVNIGPSSTNQLSLSGKINIEAKGIHSDLDKNYKIVCVKQDSTLKVSISFDDSKGGPVVVGYSNWEAVLNFEVPGITSDVIVLNTSGDVSLGGLNTKNIDLKTNSGNIKTDNVQANIKLRCTSGDMTLTKAVGDVDAQTNSGNQTFENLKGKLIAHCTSGDIKMVQIVGDVDAQSNSGSHTLENLTGKLIAHSSSGDITVKQLVGDAEAQSVSGNQFFDNVTGNINSISASGDIRIHTAKGNITLHTNSGNIEGKEIELLTKFDAQTTSGDINMKLLNEMKDLSFDLQSVSGYLEIDKNGNSYNAEKKFILNQGTITIKGITSSGNQYYK